MPGEEKTHSNGHVLNDSDILVPKEVWLSQLFSYANTSKQHAIIYVKNVDSILQKGQHAFLIFYI